MFLNQTEMRYSAPKSEMLASIYFIEKYRPYLTRGVFSLRTDNQALSWLKRYSMTIGMAAGWIQRFDQYKFRAEHRKSVISSVSHFIAASQCPNFRHFFPGHPTLCAVI